jgi:O-antigen/teichoic acid export membrane protein
MADDEERMLTESMFALVGNVAEKGLGYGFLVVATYLIAPDKFGVYTWALSTLMLAYGWSNMNLYRSLSYFAPRAAQRDEREVIVTTLVKILALSVIQRCQP